MAFFFPSAKPRAAEREPLHWHFAGRSLPLCIVENGRTNRLTLRYDPRVTGLKVTVPPATSQATIIAFVERNRSWVEDQLRKHPERPDIRAGIKVPILGTPHRIVHAPGRGTSHRRENAGEPELVIFGDETFLKRRVADVLKKQAKAEIEPLAHHYATLLSQRVTRISYRDTVSRWGSCSSSGTLSFSWRIAMAPRPVIRYLTAHECAHLREMNHSPEFWALCRELYPRTDEARRWLKKNGEALQAIRF